LGGEAGYCEHHSGFYGSVKDEKFLDLLNEYQLITHLSNFLRQCLTEHPSHFRGLVQGEFLKLYIVLN
jgi:hypothetical protein